MSAPLIVITGPSASGKSTIADMLCQRDKIRLKRFVTCTTRAKRPGERQHRDYHFMTQEAFERAIEKNDFFEWAEVYGNYYGSRLKQLKTALTSRLPVLLVLDVQGAKSIKKLYPQTFIIFLTVTLAQVTKRLERRKTTKLDFKRRLATYREEFKSKNIASIIIPNPEGKLTETLAKVEQAIGNISKKKSLS